MTEKVYKTKKGRRYKLVKTKGVMTSMGYFSGKWKRVYLEKPKEDAE